MGDTYEMKTDLDSFKESGSSQCRNDENVSKKTTLLLLLVIVATLLDVVTLGMAVFIIQKNQDISTDLIDLKAELRQFVNQKMPSAHPGSHLYDGPNENKTERNGLHDNEADTRSGNGVKEPYGNIWQAMDRRISDLATDINGKLSEIHSLVSAKHIQCMNTTNITAQQKLSFDNSSKPATTENAEYLSEVIMNVTSSFAENLTRIIGDVRESVIREIPRRHEEIISGPFAEIIKLVNESMIVINNIDSNTVKDVNNSKQMIAKQTQLAQQISLLRSDSKQIMNTSQAQNKKTEDIKLALPLLQSKIIDSLDRSHSDLVEMLNTTGDLIFDGYKKLGNLLTTTSNKQLDAAHASHLIQAAMAENITILHINVMDAVKDDSLNTNRTLRSMLDSLANKSDLMNVVQLLQTMADSALKDAEDFSHTGFVHLNKTTQNNAALLQTTMDYNEETRQIIQGNMVQMNAMFDNLEQAVFNMSVNSEQDKHDVSMPIDIDEKVTQISLVLQNISDSLHVVDKTSQIVSLPVLMGSIYSKFQHATVMAYARNLTLIDATTVSSDSNLAILQKGNVRINNMNVVPQTSGIQVTGRLEVYTRGSWGTVCDDHFENAEARVACRSLGFQNGIARASAAFGAGIGNIWLDDLGCSGNEDDLFDCPHNGIGSHNCGHGEDTGVICS